MRYFLSVLIFAILGLCPLSSEAAHAQKKQWTWNTPSQQFVSQVHTLRYGSSDIHTALWYWKGGERLSVPMLSAAIDDVAGMLSFSYNIHVRKLMVETAGVETTYGEERMTTRSRGGIGVYQIVESTGKYILRTLKKNYPADHASVLSLMNKQKSLKWNLAHNVPFATAMALSYYHLQDSHVYKKLSSVHDRGRIWKRYYNTSAGAGSARSYVKKVSRG